MNLRSFFRSSAILSIALLSPLARGAGPWLTDYDKALAQARTEHKKVLLDFTGSDWCVWCKKLDKGVFSQASFKEYARQNLVLLEVDFPQIKKLSKKLQEQNEKLKDQYKVEGFPTLVLLDGDGKKLSEINGYPDGGPEALISKFEADSKK